uniref:Uncharacterized protein n=1 Tax=Clastoptera arizonana TaxID=38151 RepID=A0A1B6E5E8_9HEMI
MVSLIKNQIFKHLERFTKNLTTDQINLSAYKGEGEFKLDSIELDENVLTDLLELPSWLQITSASCNKVTFRIQWTKLKRVPIHLKLENVAITVRTCENLRSSSVDEGLSNLAGSKYSYIKKVIDGITITIDEVSITFTSPAFKATALINTIVVSSKTPDWQQGDLTHTYLKDSKKEQILIFKELHWETLRIEAVSIKHSDLPNLILLTNHTKCRITIKKRLSDCFVLGCRLALLLDNLFWGFTDSQLKAAFHFIDSLSDLIKKDTEISRKRKAARKLEVLPEHQAQVAQTKRVNEKISDIDSSNKKISVFDQYDFIETSYHLCCKQINLHLSDDNGMGRSVHPNLKKGGAFEINLRGFHLDYYPYHLASGNRGHWAMYKKDSSPHSQWLEEDYTIFKSNLFKLIEKPHSTQHTPLSRNSPVQSPIPDGNKGPNSPDKGANSPDEGNVKSYLTKQFSMLMTACLVLRIEDFTLYRVSIGTKELRKEFIKGEKFYKCDRERDLSDLCELMTLHAEFTYYYYPGDISFPLPAPKFYVLLNPVTVNFDLCTLIWLNSFALNLHQSLIDSSTTDNSSFPYIDVKIEAIMPKLILESNNNQSVQKDRPKSLHFQVSRAFITNVRSLDRCSRADLSKCINEYQLGSLFYGEEFPSQSDDLNVVTEKFIQHVECKDNIRPAPNPLPTSSVSDIKNHLTRELLWVEAKDVWCILLEPVWGDFYGARSVGIHKPVPFLDAFPVTIWVHGKPSSDVNNPSDIHALVYISNLISVQINRYQFLFLLRLADEASELTTFLALDSNRILKCEKNDTVVVGGILPQLEVTTVMPSQCPGKESSGGDMESEIPDSSSQADDIFTNPSVQGNIAMTSCLQELDKSNHTNQNSSLNKEVFPPQVTSPQVVKTHGFLSSSMKKGFNSIISTIDTALKQNDDASETLSLRSDGSSDSENFVVVKPCAGDAMFIIGNNTSAEPMITSTVEIASEVMEDEATLTTPSESHSFASSYKRPDPISLATFKLRSVEFIHQSKGFQSNVKAQISSISAEECSSIPWDEFQKKFCTRSRGWTEMPINVGSKPKICARLDHRVLPMSPGSWENNAAAKDSWFDNLLTLKISNSELDLSLSTISGLSDLVEDEVISKPLAMEISLENVQLHLSEERSFGNIGTTQGTTPLDVSVTNLRVCRGSDGVFHVEPPPLPTPCDMPTTPLETPETLQLKSENERLRRRLAAMEKVNEENHFLRKCQEESQLLRSCLDAAQDSVTTLLEEKRNLLELVHSLKNQTSASDAKFGNSKR